MSILNVDRPTTPLAKLLFALEARAPERFAPLVAQARRDMAVVEGRLLRGDKPSPLVARRASRSSDQVAPKPAVKPDESALRSVPVVAHEPRKAVSLVTILDGGREHSLEVERGQLLLEAALASGANLAFSCTLGGCGTCKVHLVSGEIEMEEPNCLTPEEIASGLRLVCVGRATSPECVIRVEREPA